MFHPIYEAAERNRLALAFHHSAAIQTAIGWPRYFVELHTLIVQVHQAQLTSLVFGGVFDKFPSLKAVFLEGGFTWVPSLMWRMDEQWKSLRAEVPWVTRRPSEVIRSHIRFSTQPMEDPEDPTDLLKMVEMMGSDRLLMFSSDYPHYDYDSPARSIPHCFPHDLTERIMFLNAADFYGLSVASGA